MEGSWRPGTGTGDSVPGTLPLVLLTVGEGVQPRQVLAAVLTVAPEVELARLVGDVGRLVLETVVGEVVQHVQNPVQGVGAFGRILREMVGDAGQNGVARLVHGLLGSGRGGQSDPDEGILVGDQHELLGQPGGLLAFEERGQFRVVKGCGHIGTS